MDKETIKKKIRRLKKEKNAVLLVHNYQIGDIQDLADFLGDSLGLSREATRVSEDIIIFCGVKFMAETAKILSPEKTVLLPRLDAGCPMADMVDVEGLLRLKTNHPNATVVTYVNSTAEVKAESDVCCTSANAVKVVQNIESDEIIFTPDRNLAAYVQRFTNKKIIPWEGFCYVHERFTKDEVIQAKKSHPDALLVVHPECPPEVIDQADEVLSTSGMIQLAKLSPVKKFLIGTEEGILYRLKKENPEKTFYSAGVAKVCQGMKVTRLEDLYQALLKEQHAIKMSETTMNRARKSLESMLHYV
ncbi:quinolinate synthase NadA [bacterium]|nr:quinolinate synthase NadA [bacterium]